MIFLTNENLHNNEEVANIISNEKQLLNLMIESQGVLKSILLDYMQQLADSTDNVDTQNADTIINILNDFKNSLELLKVNSTKLNELLAMLDNIKLEIDNKNKIEDINNFNNTYLDGNNTILYNTLQIEKTIQSASKYTKFIFSSNINLEKNDKIQPVNTTQPDKITEDTVKTTEKSINNTEPDETTAKPIDIAQTNECPTKSIDDAQTVKSTTEPIDKVQVVDTTIKTIDNTKPVKPTTKTEENNSLVENTLLISETKGKVFLPYTKDILDDILNNNPEKYTTYEEIIEKDFSLPFDLFRNPAIARFREAYRLIRKKEKDSVKEAFELGMELLFNYDLHPAIISACKNLDELDIYLDYLETNELEKFDCFKIVFDIAPVVVKNKK